MKTIIKSCIFILLLCGVYRGIAQNSSTFVISGRVIDVSDMAVEFANVSLQMQDSVNVANTFTDNNGHFLLRDIHKGRYKLSISYFSQELYSQDIVIDGNIDLAIISVDCGITLNETVVTAKPTLKKEAGRYVLENISLSKFAKNRSTLEFLTTVPMIEPTPDGNALKIRNRGDATILINGKKVGGNDVAMSMLQSIPAEEIKKIEVIKSPDSKYSASDRNGIINVIVKRKENEGLKGALSMNYLQSFYSNQHADIFLSHSKGRWIITSGLRFNNDKYRSATESTYRDYVNRQSTYLNTKTVSINRYYTPFINANYRINTRQSIGIQLNSRFIENSNKASTESDYYALPQTHKDSTNRAYIQEYSPNNRALFFNANYNLITDDNGGRLDIDINHYRSKNNQKRYNSFLLFNNDRIQFLQNPNIYTNVIDAKIDYVKTFANKGAIKTGISYTNSSLNNNYYSEILEAESNAPVQKYEDRYKYTDYTLALYASYEKAVNDKLQGKIGLRFEQFASKGEMKSNGSTDTLININVFPTLSILYTPHDNHEFSLDIGTSITRPQYERITPFVSYTSPTSIKAGNTYLKPTYSIEVSFNYTFFQDFSFDFEYTHDKNLFNNFDVIGENGTIRNITANYGKSDSYYFSLMYSSALMNERWNVSASAEYNYSKEKGSYNQINLGYNNSNYKFRVKNNILLNKKRDLILSVNYSYDGNNRSILGKIGNLHSLTALLSKAYKNWYVAIGAYDLARSTVKLNEDKVEFSFYKYNKYFKTYYINLRYSFGKQKVKQIYDKQTDINKRLQ